LPASQALNGEREREGEGKRKWKGEAKCRWKEERLGGRKNACYRNPTLFISMFTGECIIPIG